MKKIIFFTLLFMTSLFSQERNIKLQLNWLHQFQFAGYYVAKEKGYYSNNNLDVDIIEFSNDVNLIDSILKEEIDFSIGRSSLLIDKSMGTDIVALGAIYQTSPLVLLTTNKNIKSIEDFKNKRIMITPEAENSAAISAMLKSNNILDKDLIYQAHSFNIEDLISENTDLMASYISNEPIALNNKKIEYKSFDPKDYGFNFYSDILFTSGKFVKENPIITKKFYEATIKGWEYAFENIIETSELIYEKYNTQNKTLIQIIKEAEILKTLVYNNKNNTFGYLDKNRLENIVDTFKTLGFIKTTPDYDSFIYEHNHPKNIIVEITAHEKEIIVLLALFSFIILAIVLFFINKIHQEKKLLNIVINSSEDLIFYKNNELKYIGCNKAFMNLLDLPKEEILGKTDFELFENKYAKIFRDNDLKVLRLGKKIINTELLEFEKKQLFYQSKKVPLNDGKKHIGILGVSRDITELTHIQEQLKEQALRDELTKAFNRKAFNEKIQEKFDLYKRYDTSFCLAILDIDDFKRINDSYGHDIGDKVLQHLSNIIAKNIRKTDLFFRIGGEEFAIIYPKSNIHSALTSLKNLQKIINETKMCKLHDIFITNSIGLTEINRNDDINNLFKRADNYLYNSKNNGKDRITTELEQNL